MSHPPLGYRADIDGLRAIAVGLVVVFHFQLIPISGAGFMGVDIFFVISGFLITRIIISGLEAGNFKLSRFYMARIKRLYPALLTVLALYLVAGWILFLPDQFRELSLETVLSQLYVVNFYFWREVNYFGLQAKTVPLLHMWSLAVEEQFYIFYPLVLMALARVRWSTLFWVLAVLVVGSFCVGLWATYATPGAAFYLLPARAWELGVGGLLAVWLNQRPQISAGLAHIAGLVGIVSLGLALALYTPLTLFPGWFALLPVTCAAAFILAGSRPVPVASTAWLGAAPMVWIGRISYPLYLVHWPVIIVMNETLQDVTWGWRMGGLVLSVLISWAILTLVETPMRKGRVFATPRQILGVIGGGSAALTAFSVVVVIWDGLPGRFDPAALRYLAYAESDPAAPNLSACEWPARAPCPLGRTTGPPEIAVIGDSHAWAIAGAADLWLDKAGHSGQLLYASGCMPVLGTGRPDCSAFVDATIERIVQTPSVKTVMLVSIWRQYDLAAGLAINGTYLRGEAMQEAFVTALVTTIDTLQAAGKKVVLVEPLYAARHRVPQTMARNITFDLDWPLDTALATHRAEFAHLEPVLARAAAAGAYRVSLIEALCASGTCPALIDDVPVFADTNHLHFSMSPYMAAVLAQTVPPEALP